jgi:hypothetical protein
MIATPCFTLFSEKDANEDKMMLCAGSIFEKELWLQVKHENNSLNKKSTNL